ncbi:MAG: MMPL family transporter, partial [Chloroflexota bacterium]|nr:MMPL family transporter [Chloroflexota bacterium]
MNRNKVSMFGLLASLAASWRRAAAVIVAWIVVGVVVIVAAPPLGDVTTNNQEDFLPSDSESRRALELVTEKFPRGQGVPAIIVFHRPEGLSESDLAAIAGVDAVLQSDSAPDEVQSVLSLSGSPDAAGALRAPDGKTVTTIVTLSGSRDTETFGEAVRWVRDQAQAEVEDIGLTVAVTGPAGIVSDAVEVFGTF